MTDDSVIEELNGLIDSLDEHVTIEDVGRVLGELRDRLRENAHAPTVDRQFYEGLSAARRTPCIRAVPGSVIQCCGAPTDDERTVFDALADRLGEHPDARNYEVADSGEYETKLRGPVDVEVLAEWLAPTVAGLRRSEMPESHGAAAVLAEVREHAQRWADRPPTSPYAMGLRDAWRTILTKIQGRPVSSGDDHDPTNCPRGRSVAQCILDCTLPPRVAAEPQGEPSDARVEAAARALFEEPGHDPEHPDYMSWDDVVAEDRERAEIWREDARRVLRAADAVGVVAEEPEWGTALRTPRGELWDIEPESTRRDAEAHVGACGHSEHMPDVCIVVSRTPGREAGPWVPVKQEPTMLNRCKAEACPEYPIYAGLCATHVATAVKQEGQNNG